MSFLATRVSRGIEVQMEKAPLCENPFHVVNPFSSHLYVSPWASMSAPIFPSGLSNSHGGLGLYGSNNMSMEVIETEFLFSKILTASDVGKLNCLLIPKKFAEKYFPKISKTRGDGDYHILTFEDSSTGLLWHFRFSLCRGSNTYVLNKGWSAFIKEKKLNNGDTVSFYRSAGMSAGTNHIFIHIKPHAGISYVPHRSTIPMFTPFDFLNDEWACESLGFGSGYRFEPTWKPLSFGSRELTPMTVMSHPTMFIESKSLGNNIGRAKKRLRLFGVDIDLPPCASGDDSFNGCTNGVA
ncbi:unnamed protein product [Urochloa decumbens]|uniref:TF-B3 domain-containing protein n=1 Tax=Urochloa decumbens TaxID=240449 RepID=A0ABC9CLH6_9POAL